MKRWLAGWLSVVILFSGGFCLAEAPQEKERADLEETVVTVEGENLGTVSENLVFLVKMIGDEDVQDLLKNEEVKSVAWEIATRVFLWMYENRPVTMKILAELGIGEGDRHCVEKLWDSAERIHAALDAFSDSDEGVQLMMEFDALTNDPDILLSMNEFLDLLTSEDLTVLLNAIPEVVNESIAERKDSDGSLTQQALDRKVDRSSFLGTLIFRILFVMDHSEWARNSVPKLLENENLWTFLTHLTSGNKELDRVFREEFVRITSDPEVKGFFKQTLLELRDLAKAFQPSVPGEAEQDVKNGETTGEEVAQ